MLGMIFYALMTIGILGFLYTSLNLDLIKLTKKLQLTLSSVLFAVGIVGAFWLENVQMATVITVGVAMILGGYISIIRPGIFSIRAVKGIISFCLFLIAMMIIEMPSYYLLPEAGGLTYFEKIIFCLLAFHSVIAVVGSFPARKIFKLKILMPCHVFYGLKFLILSIVVLFITTESPIAIFLLGLGTAVMMFYYRVVLIKTERQKEIYRKASDIAFALQIVWLSLLLSYVPLMILASVFAVIFVVNKQDLLDIKNEIILPKLKK
ncbi:MAG: hypothetical protein ACTSXL_04825 [Alphaproteobacteria bacterium]|nr:MAG: hypothetical protein B6I23_00355 [Rickettsiaceae bacterium 4572_127]